MIDRDFLRGFIKLYAFSLAADGEVYGLKILEEMNQHGFSLSPGTLYPALHALLREQDVTVHQRMVEGKNTQVLPAYSKRPARTEGSEGASAHAGEYRVSMT